MAKQTVELTEEAYELLTERQDETQTLSDVILAELATPEPTHGEGIDRAELTTAQRGVLERLEEQMDAAASQDVMSYLEAMHPQARTQQLQQQLVNMWSEYELSYDNTVEDITVEDNEAVAIVTQTTEKVSGPEFDDNTIRNRFELVKDDGQWWILDSQATEKRFH